MIKIPHPTFIVAGGVRCASGWIRECLSEHPDIYIHPKEIHFFDQNYEKGLKWYLDFFKDQKDKLVLGEKTATYLHTEKIATLINDLFPNIKLIFCLRDPVDRMISHYIMSASIDNTHREIGFLESIENDPRFLEWGKYAKQLSQFLSQIPRENLLIKIYEDLERDPFAFISEIYDFIGAASDFKAPSTQLRTKLGQLEHNSPFWGNISRIMLHPRAPFLFRSIYTKIRPKEESDKINENMYGRFADYYREDILQLEDILERDLSIWRTKGML